ncbi:MAG TPA: YfaZ family outer membrane protein [Gammaproteobacteria bacterium]
MRFQCQAESRWIRHIMGMILLVAGWPVAMAQTLDINLSDDTAQFKYITPVGFQNRLGGTELELGFLSTTTDDVMAIAGFQAVDEAGSGSPGLKVGVGVKGFAGTINSNDVYAVTLGAEGRFAPPALNRFGIYGSVHFAPDVVTFGDTERLVYINVRLEYEILSQATAYLGYRKIRADLTGGEDVSIDNGAHIGLQFLF